MSIKFDFYFFISLICLLFLRQLESFFVFYGFVCLHELAHIVTAIALKIPVKEIVFLPFGVNAKFEFHKKKKKEIIVALAGPLFSVLCAFFCQEYSVQNFFIFLLNSIPIYPLDGGRILKNSMCLLWGNVKGISVYQCFLRAFVILFLIVNIIGIVYLKQYRLLFVSFYILEIAWDEMKKDKWRKQVEKVLNIELE